MRVPSIQELKSRAGQTLLAGPHFGQEQLPVLPGLMTMGISAACARRCGASPVATIITAAATGYLYACLPWAAGRIVIADQLEQDKWPIPNFHGRPVQVIPQLPTIAVLYALTWITTGYVLALIGLYLLFDFLETVMHRLRHSHRPLDRDQPF